MRTRASTIAKAGLGRAAAFVTGGLAAQGHRSAKSFSAKRSIFISITRFGAMNQYGGLLGNVSDFVSDPVQATGVGSWG